MSAANCITACYDIQCKNRKWISFWLSMPCPGPLNDGSHQGKAALHVPLPDCAQSNARGRTRTHAAACTQKMQCARSMTQKLNERIIPSSQFAHCTAHYTALLARSISYYSRDHLSSFRSIDVRGYDEILDLNTS